MADLGQDEDSLKLKLMEIQYSIDQSRLAYSSIELDEARIKLKLNQYTKSKDEIKAQLDIHEKNKQSILSAIRKLNTKE